MVGMSSDTRQVISIGNILSMRHVDSEGKIKRLSNYVIFGGGGKNYYVDKIREHLEKERFDFLDEYLPTVELLIKEVMKERESHELFQFILNGFNSDGTTGIITFNAESDTQAEYKVLEYGYFLDEIIAPSDDELSAIEGFPIEFPSDISTLPQTVVERFATIQKACNENDPETVSNKCVYSVIMRDPVTLEFKIYEDTITLT